MKKYTWNDGFQARYGSTTVIVPDQVADDQRGWYKAGNKSFPALRIPVTGETVRVHIDSDAYGLFTSGTGDMVVRAA